MIEHGKDGTPTAGLVREVGEWMTPDQIQTKRPRFRSPHGPPRDTRDMFDINRGKDVRRMGGRWQG